MEETGLNAGWARKSPPERSRLPDDFQAMEPLVLTRIVVILGLLAAIAFFSVISSHASSGFRYYLIWGRGRITGAETKG